MTIAKISLHCILKNIFFTEHHRTTASVDLQDALSLFFQLKSRTPQYLRQRDISLTEHILLLVWLRFQQYSSFSQIRLHQSEHLKFQGKKTPQNTFFAEQLPVAAFVV